MKKRLLLWVCGGAVLAGCGEGVPEKNAAEAAPPPAAVEATEEPAPEPVAMVRGILDWSAYGRWVAEPPVIWHGASLAPTTRELLARQVELAEAVLFPVEDGGPVIDAAAEIAGLARQFPGAVTYQEQVFRIVDGRRVQIPVGKEYHTDANNFVERYRRRFASITPVNIASVTRQLEIQIRRDVDDIGQNYLQESDAGRQHTANRMWLRKLEGHLGKYQSLAGRLAAERARPGAREVAVEAWGAFEREDLPLLRRALESGGWERYPVSAEGDFSHPAGGEAILHFRIGGRDLFYPMRGAHRFRVVETGSGF